MSRVARRRGNAPRTGHIRVSCRHTRARLAGLLLAVTPCMYGARMNMNCKSNTVYGERFEDLLPALLTIQNAMTIDDDGMYQASFALDAKDGKPLRRALMRAEAELLVEEADSIGCPDHQDRTHGQRAADALVRLFQAMGDRATH